VDVAAELVRLKREQERLAKDITSKERQLGDETFRSRAPEKIIKGLEVTLAERRIELKKVRERTSELESGK
jgi:valyl-tRNA synthetase